MNPTLNELRRLKAQARMDMQFYECLMLMGFLDAAAVDGYRGANEALEVLEAAIESETCEGT